MRYRVDRLRALLPYLAALAGVALISAAIGLVRLRWTIPNLSMVYLLLVLLLAARSGVGPAVLASVAAFGAYDYFFVPPYRTLTVADPNELLGLVLLLAAALVTGALVDRQRSAQEAARRMAAESGELYRLATLALREADPGAALALLVDHARRSPGVISFSVVGVDGVPAVVAGDPLPEDVLRQAGWSFQNRAPVGIRVAGERLVPIRSRPAGEGRVYLPLAAGAVVASLSPRVREPELRMFAALAALADLVNDRRRAGIAERRARSLEADDRLKAAILSSISHELKSPIASLRAGITALFAPSSGLDGEQRRLLAGLDGQAERLDRLVGDLLTMSRLEAGVAPETEPSGRRAGRRPSPRPRRRAADRPRADEPARQRAGVDAGGRRDRGDGPGPR
jgi:two-component system, OmpR family, sensor histidine kinase KdpD